MEFTVAEQGIPERDRGLRHSRILRKKKMKITTLLTIIPKNHLDDVTSPMLGGRQWENCWAPTQCTILQRGRTCITMQYFHIKVQICLQNCKGLGAVSKDSFLQQAIPLATHHLHWPWVCATIWHLVGLSWIQTPRFGWYLPSVGGQRIVQWLFINIIIFRFSAKLAKRASNLPKGKLCGDEGKVGRSQIRKWPRYVRRWQLFSLELLRITFSNMLFCNMLFL